MSRNNRLEKLRKVADKLSHFPARTVEEEALLGFAVGVTYALKKAVALGYVDRTGAKGPPSHAEDLREIARKLASDTNLHGEQWRAGFYFNSALQRMAGLAERIDKYEGDQKRLGKTARNEVNRMKHDVSGVLRGRNVTLDDALDVLQDLVSALIAVGLRRQ